MVEPKIKKPRQMPRLKNLCHAAYTAIHAAIKSDLLRAEKDIFQSMTLRCYAINVEDKKSNLAVTSLTFYNWKYNMEIIPPTLYKYLPPSRVEVLDNLKIRFTQPSALNDPFEFNLTFQDIITGEELYDEIMSIDPLQRISEAIDNLPESERAIFSALTTEQLTFLKHQAAKRFFTFENMDKIRTEHITPHTTAIKEKLRSGLDKSIGILSLSANATITPMWASYADNSKGFVIGFDTTNTFFQRRRSESDELYHLRKVIYEDAQPIASISKMTKNTLIQKSKFWEYEDEWRMLLPLKTASTQFTTPDGDEVFLFDLPPAAISHIIFGLNTADSTVKAVQEAISKIEKNSHIKFSKMEKGTTGFAIVPLKLL